MPRFPTQCMGGDRHLRMGSTKACIGKEPIGNANERDVVLSPAPSRSLVPKAWAARRHLLYLQPTARKPSPAVGQLRCQPNSIQNGQWLQDNKSLITFSPVVWVLSQEIEDTSSISSPLPDEKGFEKGFPMRQVSGLDYKLVLAQCIFNKKRNGFNKRDWESPIVQWWLIQSHMYISIWSYISLPFIHILSALQTCEEKERRYTKGKILVHYIDCIGNQKQNFISTVCFSGKNSSKSFKYSLCTFVIHSSHIKTRPVKLLILILGTFWYSSLPSQISLTILTDSLNIHPLVNHIYVTEMIFFL